MTVLVVNLGELPTVSIISIPWTLASCSRGRQVKW